MNLRRVLACLLFSVCADFGYAEPPRLEFGSGPPTIQGVPVGSKIAWIAMVRERESGRSRLTVLRKLEPVTPQRELGVDRRDRDFSRSVWLIADVTGGLVVRGSAPEYEVTPQPIDVSANRGADTIVVRSTSIHGAWVRRADESMWMLAAADGGSLDADGVQNGIIVLRLSDARPHRGSPPTPAVLSAGDVLLLIDPDDVRAAAIEVAE